jgi:fatty-acyl-CoA synthase
MAGAKLLFPDRWMGDGAALLELAREEDATLLAGVPTVWIGLLRQIEQTGIALPTVHTIVGGGSAVPPALIEGMDRHDLRVVPRLGDD